MTAYFGGNYGKAAYLKGLLVRQGDWKLVRFHGDEYSINRGSSYNSYLIKDKKTVLIDTVWLPYDEEFIENLKKRWI
jgi:anaerobic nitric oxide reductase flavorubredoxin